MKTKINNKQSKIKNIHFVSLQLFHCEDSHHVTIRDEEVVTWTGRGEPDLWLQHTTCGLQGGYVINKVQLIRHAAVSEGHKRSSDATGRRAEVPVFNYRCFIFAFRRRSVAFWLSQTRCNFRFNSSKLKQPKEAIKKE